MTLENIIQRCHERRGTLLRQRKTVITPALYKQIPYHFRVHCARGYPVGLDALERAGISFMPIGRAPENDQGPRDLGGERFLKRQGIQDWRYRRLNASWGIQIYTGIPSERDEARWHDLRFTYQAVCAAPDTVLACVEALVKTTGKPLLTLTKSGGLRFSCRIPDYLHSNTEPAKFYTYKRTPTSENPHHRDVYLEILGDKGYSRWDTRYEVLLGDLLNPPIISQEVLFMAIDAFRDALHEPDPSGETHQETALVSPSSLGSENLDLAKEAFVNRGFSYLREDGDFHHWVRQEPENRETHVSLWEDRGIVWVRGVTPNSRFPMNATPITAIWDDTGIAPPLSLTNLPVSGKVLAVREGKLSPLALKRSVPILHRRGLTKKVYGSPEEKVAEIQHIFQQDARVLGIISETVPRTDTTLESYLLNQGPTCLYIPNRRLAEAAEQRYETYNLPSFARWRVRNYHWEEAKALPVDTRMANPFQSGNPCEDPERCNALQQKGGKAYKSICSQCPVLVECQQRGYLSQPRAFKNVKAQILSANRLFLNPRRAAQLERILGFEDGIERTCILDETIVGVNALFLECQLSSKVLEEWAVNWRGDVLGNFAKALSNALELQSEPNDSAIARVRAAVEGFQRYEASLIHQMCHVNVRGKVVERGFHDPETGRELAHFTIEFKDGSSAYIPLDAHAEDRLREKGRFVFSPDAFVPDEDMRIPMQMAEAIALGVLDTRTVKSIQAFPTVSKNSNWTFWHQLRHFFSHYTRDTDAPMRWNDDALWFWMPPVLHPSIKRLLLISPTLSKRQLHKVFPNEEIEVVRTQPTRWISGNTVFQLRTEVHSLRTILNWDNNWDVLGLSKLGERFFSNIRAEIDRDTRVKHAVITNKQILRQLTDIAGRENVCFLKDFKQVNPIDLEKPDVVWIVGVPILSQKVVWRRAQMLFGNDEEPLYYEQEVESGHYKDERIQGIHYQSVAGSLARIVGYVGLSFRANKKVVLLTSMELPDITDRPETLLFDWEDFEVAGGLEKLPEVIATRERFEVEAAQLTAESSRREVERVLGCSTRTANRFLQKLRGGTRVSFQEQILTFLADGEKKASEIVAAVGSSSQSVGNELRRLVGIGEIVKVRRGVYKLPES